MNETAALSLLLNVGLLVTLSFLGSLLFRTWPLSHTRREKVVLSAVAALSGIVLMLVTPEVVPGVRVDLRYVPVALVTLRYGGGWGALVGLAIVLARLPLGGPILSLSAWMMAAVLLLSVALRPLLADLRAGRGRAWLVATAAFSLGGAVFAGSALVGGPLLGADLRPLAPLFPLVLLGNLAGLGLSLAVLEARLRLLRLGATYRAQALTDPLTLLPNRRAFHDDAADLRPGEHLLLLDVDHFKRVNDTLGHGAGDEVLRWLAGRLQNVMRREDRLYRLGGEEFGALLAGTDDRVARRVALRCIAEVRDAPNPPLPGLHVTLSGGLARLGDGEGLADLYRRADEALYRAKVQGRDRLALGDPQTDSAPGVSDDAALPPPPNRAGDPTLSTGERFSMRRAMRATLALLAREHELQDEDWQTLLDAAVASVPGAEAGSLNVREGPVFRMCAQFGFDDRLLGGGHSESSQVQWYARPPELWRSGRARTLRGTEIDSAGQAAGFMGGGPLYGEAGRIPEIRATLCLPVVVDGEVVAHLNLDSFSREDAFDLDAERVAEEFGAQVAALVGAQRRRGEEAKRRRELEALVKVTAALGEAHGEEDVARALTVQARALFDTRGALYLRYAPEDDALRSGIISAVGGRHGKLRVPRGQGLVWTALIRARVLRTCGEPASARNALLAAPLLNPNCTPRGALLVTRTPDRPFTAADERLAEAIAALGLAALERASYVDELRATREGALLTLGVALEARDFETRGHTERVVNGALVLAEELGLDEDARSDLRKGALLHDVGKLAVPDRVLLKPGPLTDEEWEQMRAHPERGFDLARRIPFIPGRALEVVLHHHERWDGGGYPRGLAGEAIPLLARVFSVVDVYDALTSARPYKAAWTPEAAIGLLRGEAGRQFDPAVVDAFLAAWAEGKFAEAFGAAALPVVHA